MDYKKSENMGSKDKKRMYDKKLAAIKQHMKNEDIKVYGINTSEIDLNEFAKSLAQANEIIKSKLNERGYITEKEAFEIVNNVVGFELYSGGSTIRGFIKEEN